jgi:2'-hydroxyisoflavone reductase
MKILIIGGGVFVGKAIAEAASGRGHRVTIFNRGKTTTATLPGIEWIKGDRDGDLSALHAGGWDAVIDTCAYFPRQVRALLGAVGSTIGHYTFISSVSAYADISQPGLSESAPLAPFPDAAEDKVTGATYGPLKSECEKAALDSGVGAVLLVRPGIIAGPWDPTGRFACWLNRVARGGEMLVPGGADATLQLIDVRDLAAWIIPMVETRSAGAFNTVGAGPFTWGDMLAACSAATRSTPTFTWVSDAFIAEQGVTDWTSLPFYLFRDRRSIAGLFQVDGSAALRTGLVHRPFAETTADTYRWLREGAPKEPILGLAPEREKELLAAWHARKA